MLEPELEVHFHCFSKRYVKALNHIQKCIEDIGIVIVAYCRRSRRKTAAPFYCKIKVLNDGVTKEPFDLVMCLLPEKDTNKTYVFNLLISILFQFFLICLCICICIVRAPGVVFIHS